MTTPKAAWASGVRHGPLRSLHYLVAGIGNQRYLQALRARIPTLPRSQMSTEAGWEFVGRFSTISLNDHFTLASPLPPPATRSAALRPSTPWGSTGTRTRIYGSCSITCTGTSTSGSRLRPAGASPAPRSERQLGAISTPWSCAHSSRFERGSTRRRRSRQPERRRRIAVICCFRRSCRTYPGGSLAYRRSRPAGWCTPNASVIERTDGHVRYPSSIQPVVSELRRRTAAAMRQRVGL